MAVAISRYRGVTRVKRCAITEPRNSDTNPTTRRPSSGWDDSAWQTAPSGRRPLPGGWGGYAPGYPVSTPRFGAWDALLAWSLLNSLSRPQAATYFQDHRNDPGYAQWRTEADRKAQSDPAVAQKLAELDGLMGQAKAQPAAPARRLPTAAGAAGCSS